MSRKHKVFRQNYVIKETDLDFLGHMNNANFIRLFEEARWDVIDKEGFGMREIQQSGQGPIILGLEVKFSKELRARDEVTISTQLQKMDRLVGKLEQKMVKADGTVACHAVFTFGIFDMKLRKLVPPSEQWLSVFYENE